MILIRAFLLGTTFLSLTFSSSAQQTYLYCGKLINGFNDKTKSEVTIIIEDKEILEVQGGYVDAPVNTKTVNLKDKTVLPGLIDLHVHLEGQSSSDYYIQRFTLNDEEVAFNAASYAKITLMAGFTTVRDLGGRGVNIALRDAINAGKIVGPRIFTAGKPIATTGGHADPTNGWRKALMGEPGPKQGVVNGPYEARKAVRQRYKNGVDLIKLTVTGGVLSLAKSSTAPQFQMDELEAVIKTANDIGYHVAAHAHGVEGMKRAIKAGVKTIEHGTLMDEETMELMKKNGTYFVPTITAGKSVSDSAKIPGYYPEVVVPKALAIGPKIQKTFTKAYERGVKVAFGTDAGVFKHGMNAKEFGYLVEAGMSPMEAIQSATTVAAEVLQLDEKVGAIRKGYLADMIAVNGDPLEDITTMEQVVFVMKAGKIYKNEN